MTIYTILLSLLTVALPSFSSESRLKDLVTIKGVRDNPLVGYGLVIGLNGTGDGGGEITNISVKRMLQKLGLNPQQEIASKNIAAVIVSAIMPPFSRTGQKIDITVSAIAGASSLAGGTLLVTPLKGGDGQVYAIAHGQMSIGGAKQGLRFATTGTITSGATVEKEIATDFSDKKSIRLNLNWPDFTTAARVEKTLNEGLGGKFAQAKDSSTIDLMVPSNYERNLIQLMAIIENYRIVADQKAQVIINERTGTIVAGGDVVIKEVAIAHNDLTVKVTATPAEGGATGGKSDESPGSVHLFKKGTSLTDLVNSLNALGASPEDLINIFRALKENNALVADLIFK